MFQRPPRSTRTDTLFPYTTFFRAPVRVRLRLPALLRLPGARPARLLDADLRGDRQAPLHHCRLQRVAAAVAAGAHLHPGLDPAPGPQLGDRKSTRLNSVTNAHLVCRLLLEKNKKQNTDNSQR